MNNVIGLMRNAGAAMTAESHARGNPQTSARNAGGARTASTSSDTGTTASSTTSSDTASGGTQAGASTSALATKETFLTLLVAQIKNQNPLSPADGTEFLTQLAQFTQLEQLISIREELEGMARQQQELNSAG